MVKYKHLVIVDRFVTLLMGFSMGLMVGTGYPQARIIPWLLVLGICAFAKIELYHWGRKLQRSEQQ